ncbi:MAG: hypothetical protein WBM43_05605 [Flavobacteriaceae bacterium]
MKIATTFLALILIQIGNSQEANEEPIPYKEIPEYPDTYTAGSVVSRMLDGLGFRYYWATKDLRPEDLAYKPSESNRTIAETIDHIYNLSRVIYNSAVKKPNDRTGSQETNLSFPAKRALTLKNIKQASEIFLNADTLEEHKVIFINQSGAREYPFWNQINGPIEDAVWHCGQVVALRRASGNPFDSKVSVFQGKKRE